MVRFDLFLLGVCVVVLKINRNHRRFMGEYYLLFKFMQLLFIYSAEFAYGQAVAANNIIYGFTFAIFSYTIYIYIYIYIYIHIVLHRQTVSLYHNSSVWLDT